MKDFSKQTQHLNVITVKWGVGSESNLLYLNISKPWYITIQCCPANLLWFLTLVPDDPPRNIRAIGTEPTVIDAHWLPVSNETINGIGLGYRLALFTTAGENIRNYTLNASVLSLKITGLEIWTNYSIKMAAFTIVGDGPWSDLLLEDTDEESKPWTT